MTYTRKLLASTALTTSLMVLGPLSASATELDLGGYAGPVRLTFTDHESFLTAGGLNPTGQPAVGEDNFGIFQINTVIAATPLSKVLCSGTGCIPGHVLAGVFNNIQVTKTTLLKNGTGSVVAEDTSNKGGVFNIYSVPTAVYGGDQGTAGYGNAGCSLNTLCYNGITNAAGAELLLTMDIDPAPKNLTATISVVANPPTGEAQGGGTLVGGDDLSQFGTIVGIKDSFCPNNLPITACESADGSTFALGSSDPITATVVPEPGSLGLLGTALVGAGTLWRRRRRRT